MTAQEKIGSYLLIYQKFETTELNYCEQLCKPGSWAVDVGANVGIFTLTLSHLATDAGGVIAVEPSPNNYLRLQTHVKTNDRSNVRAFQLAAGHAGGFAHIDLDVDPAFGSAVAGDAADAGTGHKISVEIRRLDDIWDEVGRPTVSFVKIDVEGGEADVVLGARELISTCKPYVLIEATSQVQLTDLRAKFAELGYSGATPQGFQPWNFIFSPKRV